MDRIAVLIYHYFMFVILQLVTQVNILDSEKLEAQG